MTMITYRETSCLFLIHIVVFYFRSCNLKKIMHNINIGLYG